MRPLRVLVGADTYPPDVNGAARFAERLAGGLAGRGHEVHVAAPSDTGGPYRQAQDGVTVHRIRSYSYPLHPTFRVGLPWSAFPATAALLDTLNPDVVHVQAHFAVGRGLIRAAARTGRAVVATNHFMPENLAAYGPVPRLLLSAGSRWAWRDLGRTFAAADVVTAPTPQAVALLAEAARLDDAVAVSCGIDIDRYGDDPQPGGEPVVLFVGRLDREKHVDELIRAVARLPAQVPATLEVVGEGACRRELTALAARLGITSRVRMRGFIAEAELISTYARAAVFVMPGVAELQSLATLEAMAAGTPVIAADAMALPHLVNPGHNGWLYPPGDVDELTDRLVTLLADPALRARMGRASRRLAEQHALGRTLDTFEELYRHAARRGEGFNGRTRRRAA